jgi:riboflavin kinase/FMN adenylyltransferase
MKVYRNIDEVPALKNPVVTVGTFDGVHLGHQKIFETMARSAQLLEGETVVITFDPHPRLVLYPDSKDLKFINTQKKKMELIEKAGIHHLAVIPFTREFSNTASADFVKRYMVDTLGARKFVIGYDHHFGKDRQGGINDLIGLGKIHGFEVEQVPAQFVEGITVSSTKIRKALISGDVKTANKLLGYHYSISGPVVPGNKIGRTLGFPTANIDLHDRYKLISANGVYACHVDVRNRLCKGMGNIGYRPTVNAGSLTIEVNIFDFDDELYGEDITISFIDRIRDEKRFENLSELRRQLISDRAQVIDILKDIPLVY